VWVSVTLGRAYAAQDTGSGPAAHSTLEGVYTSEQAARGEKTYGMNCLGGCHNKASHVGAAFKQNWNGHQLKELYERIKDTMPDDNPGALSEKESIDVVSYMLKANGIPAGKTDLAPDKNALAKIKIELPPAGGVGVVR
jgi:S-disulfanyl-L-cysteine oxidoreductase SoxD